MLEVEIKTLPPLRLAGIPHKGPYLEIGAAYDKLFSWAGGAGLLGENTRVIGVFFDNPKETPPDQLRSLAAIAAPPDFSTDAEGVEVLDLPGGRAAACLHEGPYEGLAATYDWLYGEWMPAHGEPSCASPSFEEYLNNCEDTAPADLRTMIYAPMK